MRAKCPSLCSQQPPIRHSARLLQSIVPHYNFLRSILILSSYLCLGFQSGFIPSFFSLKTLHSSSPPHMPHVPPISFSVIWSPDECFIMNTLMNFIQFSVTSPSNLNMYSSNFHFQLLRSFQRICQSPRPCAIFHNMLMFCSKELLATLGSLWLLIEYICGAYIHTVTHLHMCVCVCVCVCVCTCTEEFVQLGVECYREVYRNTETNILLLRSWFLLHCIEWTCVADGTHQTSK